MHNCNSSPSTSRKNICHNCIHSLKDKIRKSAQFKSTSYYDPNPNNEEYASSCSNSQVSQNMSTQTTFKSNTSVNLQGHKKVDIYKERCTQTSKTVIALSELDTPRYSPDSLSPKHDFPIIDEAGDSILREFGSLSVVDVDYVPFQRKPNLNHYLQTGSKEFLTGDTLTRAYLTKNKNKVSSSQAWIADNYRSESLKSQSFIESPCKARLSSKFPKKVITRFKVKKLKDKNGDEAGKNPTEKHKRSLSFMSPTISSESKDQSLEIETIQKLISPTKKGRSLSPNNDMMGDVSNNAPTKKVPYIDSSKASLDRKARTTEEQLALNLKQSCEVSQVLFTLSPCYFPNPWFG